MLLKIYLCISILTLIGMILVNFSLVNRVKNKYGDEIDAKSKKTKKKDVAGTILLFLKLIVMSFIPLYNIVLLVLILFFMDKIEQQTDEMIKNALQKRNIK